MPTIITHTLIDNKVKLNVILLIDVIIWVNRDQFQLKL